MMKQILFNTDMVRAILDGRKTVTRRVVKPQPNGTFDQHWGGFYEDDEWILLKEPYRPGDILYVRETWARTDCFGCTCRDCDTYIDRNGLTIFCDDATYVYRASDSVNGTIKWRPSIHMPREAARIFLRVTDVRVERLQEITYDDCIKEGMDPGRAKNNFEWTWDSTIKPADRERYGWAANPWVWVIEFEQCEKPEEVRLDR